VRLFVLAIAALLALSGCQRKTDPPGEAPTGVTATPGDGLVVMSWDMLPDLTYWIFFEPGGSVAVAQPEARVIRDAVSPRPLGGLANGTQYAFVMNATHNDSAAGPNSPVVPATPRLAGDTATWTSGTSLGAPNLKGITFSGSRFVIVGDGATIFAGDYNYTSDFNNNPNNAPPGVTAWMPPTTPPAGSANLSAVTFSGAYVALGADGSILSSADGLTWASNTAVPAAPGTNMNGIAFGAVGGVTPTYVVVGDGGQIFTSTDLAQPWTPVVVTGLASDLKSVALVNGFFMVTGANGTLLTSENPSSGTAWISLTSNTANTLRGVAFNAPLALYAAVGDAGTIVTSPDLSPTTLWTKATLTPPLAESLLSITVGGASGSRFLAVGQGGTQGGTVVFCDVFCNDGIKWSTASAAGSTNLNKVFFAPAMYVAVGDAGANAVSR
jgi:hypothetical protein